MPPLRKTIFTRPVTPVRPPRLYTHHTGFTLVESIVSSVVMAVLLVASVNAITTISKGRGAQTNLRQANQLCKEMMAEVMQGYYVLPTGLTNGITRSTWLLIDDFNGLIETPPKYRNGSAITGYGGWLRKVTVEFVDPAAPDGAPVVTDMGLKRITVLVNAPDGKSASLVALRSSGGHAERKPSTQTTFTSFMDVTFDGGGSAKTSSAVELINQVP